MTRFGKRLMVEIGIGLGIFIVTLLIIVYIGTQIKWNVDAIYSTRQELVSKTKNISELSQLRIAGKDTESMLAKLEAALPNKDNLFAFSENLNSMARRNELSFNFRFVGGETLMEDGLGAQRFDMSVQGDYRNIVRFIKELEEDKFFANIININIGREGSKFNAILTGEVFFHA